MSTGSNPEDGFEGFITILLDTDISGVALSTDVFYWTVSPIPSLKLT